MAERKVTDLIDAYLDGAIAAEDFAALGVILRSDPSAARVFACRSVDHRALRHYHARPAQPASAHTKTDPSPPRAKLRVPAVRRTIYALAATLLLAGVMLAVVYSFNRRSKIEHRQSPTTLASVLDVSDAGTLMIDRRIASPGERYEGRSVSLDAGEAEFMLESGATVRMRGKAGLTVHSAMQATLHHGEVGFDCPPEAIGYTVYLPDGSKIVDLGTRFDVDLNDLDRLARITVRVEAGSVRMEPAGSSAFVVAEGSVVTWTRGGKPTIAAVPERAIEVRNFSFEEPRIERIQFLHDASRATLVQLPDWTIDAAGAAGVYVPRAFGSSFYRNAGGPRRLDGRQTALVIGPQPGGVRCTQEINETLSPGTYRLTLAIGHRDGTNDRRRFTGAALQLLAGDAVVGELAITSPPGESGGFTDATLECIVEAGHDRLGQPLSIRIALPPMPRDSYFDFDNVRLIHEPVPHPLATPTTPHPLQTPHQHGE